MWKVFLLNWFWLEAISDPIWLFIMSSISVRLLKQKKINGCRWGETNGKDANYNSNYTIHDPWSTNWNTHGMKICYWASLNPKQGWLDGSYTICKRRTELNTKQNTKYTTHCTIYDTYWNWKSKVEEWSRKHNINQYKSQVAARAQRSTWNLDLGSAAFLAFLLTYIQLISFWPLRRSSLTTHDTNSSVFILIPYTLILT